MPEYKPDYCNYLYTAEYIEEISALVKEIISKTIKKNIINIPVAMDGGNFVTNGDVFCYR